MKLLDLLSEEVILPELQAKEKSAVIDEMIELLVSTGRIKEKMSEEVRRVVHEREESMSTGIGHGVAIPHGTVSCIDDVVGVLARAPEGVEFDAIDKQPVNLIVLVLVGEKAHREHIRTLAIVSRLLNSTALRQHLLKAESAKHMMRLIAAEESGEMGSSRSL